MWVNPFWFGVIVTILVEMVTAILYAWRYGQKIDEQKIREDESDGRD